MQSMMLMPPWDLLPRLTHTAQLLTRSQCFLKGEILCGDPAALLPREGRYPAALLPREGRYFYLRSLRGKQPLRDGKMVEASFILHIILTASVLFALLSQGARGKNDGTKRYPPN